MSAPSRKAYVDEDALLEAFVTSRRNANTQKTYRQFLLAFQGWCTKRDLRLLEVETLDLARYFNEMQMKGLAPSTIAVHQSAIAAFFLFAVSENLLEKNPMTGVQRVVPPRATDEVRTLTRQQLAAVVTQEEGLRPTQRAIAALAGVNGLSITEMCDLMVEDLSKEGEHYILRLRSRGRSASTVLPPLVAERVRAAAGDRRAGFLLLDVNGKQMTRHSITRAIRLVLKRSGIPQVPPSIVRNTMIAVAFYAGCSLPAVWDAVDLDDQRLWTRYAATVDEARPENHPAMRVMDALVETPERDDLLQQVHALLLDDQINLVAPIALAGAVLEAHLRALVRRNGLDVPDRAGMARYVEALWKAQLIDQIEWRQLQVYADIRNQALHGDSLERLTRGRAQALADGAAEFISAHP